MRSHQLRAAVATAPTYVTNDLAFHIDAGNTNSYDPDGSGTTVYNLIHNDSSASYNSNISHSSSDGGYWSFGSTTGYGIEFEIGGNNNYLDIGSNDFTIEMWMKPTDLNFLNFSVALEYIQEYPQSGFTFSDYANFFIQLFNVSNQGVIQLRTWYSTQNNNNTNFYGTNFISTTWPNNSSWLHYVVTSDVSSTTRRIYKNGQFLSSLNNSNFNFVRNRNNNQLHIGGASTAAFFALPFLGDISIVRIYNGKALTSDEVEQNYDAEKSRYGY
tara:strand:- start:31 stop:843 length:813 start_codon:yes stop_codon:yes gene_type:complete